MLCLMVTTINRIDVAGKNINTHTRTEASTDSLLLYYYVEKAMVHYTLWTYACKHAKKCINTQKERGRHGERKIQEKMNGFDGGGLC